MEISAYKETGTFIMKSSEETGQMLDDHIVMTQAMSFSPYKKPFEVRITTWENKLRTTQVCIHFVHAQCNLDEQAILYYNQDSLLNFALPQYYDSIKTTL